MSPAWLWSFFFFVTLITKNAFYAKKKLQKGHHQGFFRIFLLVPFFLGRFCSWSKMPKIFFYLRSTEGVKKQKKLLFNQIWTQNDALQKTFLDPYDFDAQTEASEKSTKHLPHQSLCFWKKNFVFFFIEGEKQECPIRACVFERKSFFFSGMKVQVWKKRVFAWNFKVSRCRFLHQNAINLIKSKLVDKVSKKVLVSC